MLKQMEQSNMTASETKSTETLRHQEAPMEPVSQRGLSRWLLLALAGCAVVLGIFIYFGIHARTVAASRLTDQAERSSAIPVSVMYPKTTTTAQDIVLPGNTQ